MKTNAEYKADERKRMRKLGFKATQVWVHDADQERHRKYADGLKRRRLKINGALTK